MAFIYFVMQIAEGPAAVKYSPACGVGSLRCGVCSLELEDRAGLKRHYATPLHTTNQQRVLQGRPALSQAMLDGEWPISSACCRDAPPSRRQCWTVSGRIKFKGLLHF